ncbi:MAG: ferrous iron transport protein B [Spirochaetes bacterium]|nr:ferrous iron transport protein B [Spirochaetota bacterium]
MKPTPGSTIKVALSGNPNAGKTSLFNALTGAHQKVGNYPGVTVEKLEGEREYRGQKFSFVDLPGTYSLTAYSLDEMVARDFVLDEKPDLVVDVLDSTTLERSLALCLQFQELGVPLVGALNMSDEAARNGIQIDEKILSSTLGIPFVKTVGTDGKGADRLLDAIVAALRRAQRRALEDSPLGASEFRFPLYGSEVESRLEPLTAALEKDPAFTSVYPARWIALKLLEKDEDAARRLSGHADASAILAMAAEARAWLGKHFGKDAEIVVAEQRYGYIRGATQEAITSTPVDGKPMTERIDRFLMDKYLGLPLFFLIIAGVFELTFAVGEFPRAWLESLFRFLGARASAFIPEGLLRSLVVDGILGGVGGVLSFVPTIVILFFCLSILEDLGYMSRAAFLTDKFLHAFGLHGQSFLPMILGFGCSVPAIMAARTLKSPRDRIATILAIPFMSCGAKLPVYVLLAGAFFPKNPGNAVMGIYLAGVALSLLSTIILRKTVLKGPTTPFVMELPPYRLPTLRGVLWHVWSKTVQYIKKAGTVILAASVFIWLLTAFPALPGRDGLKAEYLAAVISSHPEYSSSRAETAAGNLLAERSLEYSFAGRVGKFIEPAMKPLGFNWKIGVAALTGFAAKETVVSTLGILYGAGKSDSGPGLTETLRNDLSLNPLTALVLMLFVLIMPPCFAALGAIKTEAGWKWLGFQVIYGFALAWGIGLLVRMFGLTLGLGV